MMNSNGRQASEVRLGRLKTSRKLGISPFTYLGDRLSPNGSAGRVPFLPNLVAGQSV
jgi:hypothetical protein